MMDEIINKIDENEGAGAPTNAVAHGGVDINPNGKKKKDDAEDVLRRTIMKKLGNRIKESDDNNNVTLKSVLKTIDKLDEAIDEKSGIKREEITLVEPEVKKTFVEKFKV